MLYASASAFASAFACHFYFDFFSLLVIFWFLFSFLFTLSSYLLYAFISVPTCIASVFAFASCFHFHCSLSSTIASLRFSLPTHFSAVSNLCSCSCIWFHYRFYFQSSRTVKPHYSVFQGTGQNYALYQDFLYCQHINNYETTSWDQNCYALLTELC